MHRYVMLYTAPGGKKKRIPATLGGDADAKFWARTVVERDGGTAAVPLQDGTTFTFP